MPAKYSVLVQLKGPHLELVWHGLVKQAPDIPLQTTSASAVFYTLSCIVSTQTGRQPLPPTSCSPNPCPPLPAGCQSPASPLHPEAHHTERPQAPASCYKLWKCQSLSKGLIIYGWFVVTSAVTAWHWQNGSATCSHSPSATTFSLPWEADNWTVTYNITEKEH